MTLQPQETEIPLTLGMATKPMSELQEPSHMRLVENLHWRSLGELERRPATETSVTVSAPSGSLYAETESYGLVARGPDPVVVTGQHGVVTYNEKLHTAQWARGILPVVAAPDGRLKYEPTNYAVSRAFVDSAQFARDNVGVLQVASAIYQGVHVIAWITQGFERVLRMKAIDLETGEVIATNEWVTVNAGTTNLSACAYFSAPAEAGVLIAYCNSASLNPFDIRAIVYNHAGRVFNDGGVLTNNASGAGRARFLVKTKTSDGTFYLAYLSSTSGNLIVQNRSRTTILSTHTATHGFVDGVDIVEGPTRTLIVSTSINILYAETFGAPADVITLATTASDTWFSCTAALEQRAATTHDAVVWVNAIGAEAPSASYVQSVEVNFAAAAPVAPGRAQIVPHAWCVSRGFTLKNRAHVTFALGFREAATSGSTALMSCVVARYNANVGGAAFIRHDPVGKLCHDRFYVRADEQNLDIFTSTSTDAFDNAWITLTADRAAATYDFGGADHYYPQTIFVARVKASTPHPMPHVAAEPGVVAVAGGFPWQFDGDTPSELAPIMAPIVRVVVGASPGLTGQYGIVGMWKWTDARGRLHRIASAPVLTPVLSNQSIDVYVSCPPLTAYDSWTAKAMDVEVYIADDTGAYQLVLTSATGGKKFHNSLTNLWFRFNNVQFVPLGVVGHQLVSDAILSVEIPPEPVPAFLHITKIADRMWAVDAEDRSRIWFSKPLVTGYGVEWSAVCTLTIGGEGVAVVDVGGYPTVLARDGIYQIAGPGPDATGLGSFSPAQRLPYEVECLDAASVCRSPLGVVFRGRRGLYALSDAPNAEPGLLIDPEMLTDPSLDPSSSTSYRLRAVYQEQTNEVHCLTPAHDRLVFNVLEQKWSRYTQTTVQTHDLCVARGKLWRIDRDPAAGPLSSLVSEALYSAVGVSYNSASGGWRIDTPWYRLDQVNGQSRLWRVFVGLKLASDPADATVTVAYYTDWNDTLGQAVSWSGAELAALASAGDVIVRLPFAPGKQLCTAFKFRITCTVVGATTCPKPLSMRLSFGVRPSKGKQSRAAVKG